MISVGALVLEPRPPLWQVGAGGQPIFRLDCDEFVAFYAPGCLCVVGQPSAGRFQASISPHDASAESARASADSAEGVNWAHELWRRAELALASTDRRQDGAFSPECLTLYLNNECNLRCVYCYTGASQGLASRLDLETIVAAGDLVAENCRRKGIPFVVVLHGGGEPTLHRGRVDGVMARLEAIAARHEVQLFRYVATNGVMPERKARWLASRFDLIGLSCDGPADIHNSQRPGWDGRGTLHLLERTAHVLQNEGCRLHVRTTITQASLHRQAEIADHICRQFSPEEIHFEPVYAGSRVKAVGGLGPEHADAFASHFLEARSVARANGIPLQSSGTRPGSLHGPYCNLFRHVINLVPGDGASARSTGVATACFKLTSAAQVHERGAAIGALNRETGRFEIDDRRVQALGQELAATMPECETCFNRYHCVGECPDKCPLDVRAGPGHPGAGSLERWKPGFRCRVQKTLASALLRETADRLWSEALANGTEEPHGTILR